MKKNFFWLFIVTVPFANISWSKEPLIFSGHPDNIPFQWVENGKLVGVGVELLETIFAGLEIPTQAKNSPWARSVLRLKAGQIDSIVGIYIKTYRFFDSLWMGKYFCSYCQREIISV